MLGPLLRVEHFNVLNSFSFQPLPKVERTEHITDLQRKQPTNSWWQVPGHFAEAARGPTDDLA